MKFQNDPITAVDIDAVYSRLHDTTADHHLAQRLLASTEAVYETAKLEALRDGLIIGKNAELRKAAEAEVLADEGAQLIIRQSAAHIARAMFDLSLVEVKWLSARTRLEALALDRAIYQLEPGALKRKIANEDES